MATREEPPKRPAATTNGVRAAWLPAEWEPADATAMQALAAGTANAIQQKRALGWIVNNAAAMYDITYRPGGHDGDRDTAFAEGRRFVGSQIVKMLKISVAAIRRGPRSDAPSEHG